MGVSQTTEKEEEELGNNGEAVKEPDETAAEIEAQDAHEEEEPASEAEGEEEEEDAEELEGEEVQADEA